MESLAIALNIPRASAVYSKAQEQYHKLCLRAGTTGKYSQACCQAACLKLSADSFNLVLDLAQAARKAGVQPRQLMACLEFVTALIGVEMGFVTIENICAKVGYPAAETAVRRLHEALDRHPSWRGERKRELDPLHPLIQTTLVYLAMQPIGLRVGLGTICAAAHVNAQHVQRYSMELGNLLKEDIARLSADEALIKTIKAAGKQALKRKRMPTEQSIAKKEKEKEKERVKNVSLETTSTALMDVHYLHELGYAIMRPFPFRATDQITDVL